MALTKAGSVPSTPTRYNKLVPLKYLIPLIAAGALFLAGLAAFVPRLAITLALIAVGFTMVWRTTWWLGIFGRVPWAEQHLTTSFGAGLGGSWMWYKLLGIVVIAIAILYFTGLLQAILVSILGPFFGGTSY